MESLANMSNYDVVSPRNRGKTLVVVEGNHEKDILFQLLFRCFPELNIAMEDVWIYGTNIYSLYNLIVKEYDEDWDYVDVDLPYIISKNKNDMEIQYKRDFTNIFLVFDYERHDPYFSEQKINKLQEYFSDSTDVGKLYINYPMIESYQQLVLDSEVEYIDAKISVTLQPGDKYKALVKNYYIAKLVDFIERIPELLEKHYGMETNAASLCAEKIFSLSDRHNSKSEIRKILINNIEDKYISTATYQLSDWIQKMQYLNSNTNLYDYLRVIFIKIIKWNIIKARNIATAETTYSIDEWLGYIEEIDLMLVLQKQNEYSRDSVNGFIYVLNTCVFLIADYNTKLLELL